MGKVEERIEIVLGWGKHWPPFIRPSRIPPPRQYFTKHPTCFFRGLPSPLFEFRPRWPRFPLETAYPRETHGTDRLLMETVCNNIFRLYLQCSIIFRLQVKFRFPFQAKERFDPDRNWRKLGWEDRRRETNSKSENFRKASSLGIRRWIVASPRRH